MWEREHGDLRTLAGGTEQDDARQHGALLLHGAMRDETTTHLDDRSGGGTAGEGPGRAGRPPVYAGRYRAEALLKSGRGVATYRGTDTSTGLGIIVKAAALDAVPDGTELLLRHEASVLAEIDSPGVAPLLEAGVEDDELYVVVPRIPGITLQERLAAGPLDLDDTFALAEGLLSALRAVFEHGVLHRDIKPANVIVDESEPLERVTLIDFGFSRSDRLERSLRDIPLGTARYASPEQAGLIGHDVDGRSDLYSLGAVLFEALAGRPPFAGRNVGEVLREHLTAPVPSLRQLGVDVPGAFDAVVQRLLAKEGKDRYQTAEAALADVRQIRRAVAHGIREPHVVVGAHDRRCCVLGEPAFVGREHELEELERALDGVRERGVALVGLEADSGGGKTRLLDEFAHRAAQRGAWVLRGQGVDQVAQRPFHALQGLADGLVAAASHDPGIADRLRVGVGHHRAAVCAALPHLTEVLAPEPEVELGPEAHGAARNVAALASLLGALGSSDRPAVVIVDDCQWADQLTIRVLDQWRRNRAAGGDGHVLVVFAHRSEEVPAGHAIRELPDDRHLELPALGEREVRDLVESMAGSLEDAALDAVVDLAEGSPFMASAVLHGLVESGALVCAHPGWQVDTDAFSAAQSSSRAATFLAQRLELLPEGSLALLTAGAVLGKEFDLDLAAHLADQDAATAVRARDGARSRHLVWNAGHGARIAFVHDKIRESLLARLDPDTRRSLHAAAAERIEAVDPRRTFELAYHFDAAQRPERALSYALAAAEQARSQNSLEIAEDQYRIARRASEEAHETVRFRVASGLGDVTMLLGRYDEARSHFTEALRLAEGPRSSSQVEAKLGELAFKVGDLDESAAATERGLRLLGRRVPKRWLVFLVWALWEIAVQAAHSLLPGLVGRRNADDRGGPGDDLLAARHYSRLAHVYWFTRGPVPTLWTHLREMNLVERYPPTRELAQAYSEHAPVMTLLPWISRGIEYVRRSHRIRTELRDVWGQGQSLNFCTIVLFTAGRYEEASERAREAISVLERTGDRWELNIARIHLAYCFLRQGRLAESVELARHIHDEGVEIGDLQASGLAVEVASKASGGRVPEDVVAAELARETRDVQLRVQVLQAEALRLLAAGETRAAVDTLSDATARARRAQVRNEYVAPARVWLVTAMRTRIEELSPYAEQRRALVREARRAARSARVIARTYRNNQPHALRESGLVAALAHRPRRACRLLRRSVEVAAARGMAHEEALSRREYGRLGEQLGWADASEIASNGARTLDAMESEVRPLVDEPTEPVDGAVTLSLVDRFDTLLDQGRRLATGLSRHTVYTAVERAATKLLRAEHCTVLDITDDGQVQHTHPADESSLSSSLIQEATERGRPVVSHTDLTGDPSESLVLAGVRSALCAPVFERGRLTACFYVTHGQVASLFGEDEVRLAEFVATLAGAALENARGFAEVEGLQRSLERRVAERTQQLTTTLHELERLNEELQETNRAKGEFVSMVSHELRTPLTPIVGLSSTMLQRWDSMEDALREECLGSIHRQGVRLASLVDDLLEMSRIESGTLEADTREIVVGDVLSATLEQFSDHLVEVEVDCPTDVVAMADPDRLHQILTNYLENAHKYGTAPIRVEARFEGPWVQISVSDHGPGVPEEFRDQLFERFARAEESKHLSGTGLGLSIVHGLARAQGGEVWYEPNEPTGSRFCVCLPRSSRRRMREARAEQAGEPATGVAEPS